MSEKKDEAIREAAEQLAVHVLPTGMTRAGETYANLLIAGHMRNLWLKAEAETARRCAEIAAGTCGCPDLVRAVHAHMMDCVVRTNTAAAIRSEFGLSEGKG